MSPSSRKRRAPSPPPPEPAESRWTFLTHHAHVLLSIAADPEARLRDVAERVGLTERAVQRIVSELQAEGYVTVTKAGRRNRYQLHLRKPLRHPLERPAKLRALVELVLIP